MENPVTSSIPKEVFRDGVEKLESALAEIPGVMKGDCYPLEHAFADGLYVRTIIVPRGQLIVTKLFKQTHATFLLSGEVSVISDTGGIQRIKAPFQMITKAGTKRVIYTHTEVVWTTVHATVEKDLQKIEEEVIAKTFEEVDRLETEALASILIEQIKGV